MPRTYCTYFDSSYLTRGLALWESLDRRVGDFELVVLCLDETTRTAMSRLALDHVRLLSLDELESADPGLLDVRPARKPAEYYFTLTPALLLHVLRTEPRPQSVTYLDADLWFFADVEVLWRELHAGSVGIIEHRFAPRHQSLTRWGIYNVGLLAFRNDARSARVLEWWRERCLEWCYDRIDGDRFADQKYLDCWPSRFEGVVVLKHHGANVAPWNAGNYRFRDTANGVHVDDAPLLFYHFHRLRHWGGRLWRLGLAPYGARACGVLANRVYRPYIRSLRRWSSRLASEGVVATRPRRFAPRWTDLIRLPLQLTTGETILE